MSKFKLSLLRSASLDPALTPSDTTKQNPAGTTFPKNYISSIKSRRFFSTRKTRSSSAGNSAFDGDVIKRITPQKKPPFISIFSSRMQTTIARTYNSRRHRQYAVSLSHPLQNQNFAESDLMNSNPLTAPLKSDPDSPLESARFRRFSHPPFSRIPYTPDPSLSSTRIINDNSVSKVCRPQSFDSGIASSFNVQLESDLQIVSRNHPSQNTTGSDKPLFSTNTAVETHKPREQTSHIATLPMRELHELHRIANILQRAVKDITADKQYSQVPLFHSLAPVAVFTCVLGVAVVFPRNYGILTENFGIGDMRALCIVLFGGISLVLIVLRGCIWVTAVLVQTFSGADLNDIFRKRGMPVEGGGQIVEADIVTGIFA